MSKSIQDVANPETARKPFIRDGDLIEEGFEIFDCNGKRHLIDVNGNFYVEKKPYSGEFVLTETRVN